MREFSFTWLPLSGWILAGTTLFFVGAIGIYDAFTQIYGYPVKHIFGYPIEKLNIHKLSFLLLKTEMFGIAGFPILFILDSFDFPLGEIKHTYIISGIITFGGVLSIIHTIIAERLISSKLKDFWGNKEIIELFSGIVISGITGGIFISGMISLDAKVSLVEDPLFVSVLLGAYTIIGAMFGAIAGLVCLFVSITGQLVSDAIATIVIPLKFKTVVCGNCFRYNEPLDSAYELGRRYCEHCQQEIPYTKEPGKVIFTFGNIPLTSKDRTFVFSNPELEQNEQPIDVAEVHIDSKTCDQRLFERFITYIINYPPRYGLRSVEIFYKGKLIELGDNLKNTLRNNFNRIEKIEV